LPPKPRSYHAGCTIGPGLFTHGGYGLGADGFTMTVLQDWGMFDLGLCVWIKLTVTDEWGRPFELPRRQHSMASVGNHATSCSLPEKVLNSRLVYCNDL
jgi:hypothetical protein